MSFMSSSMTSSAFATTPRPTASVLISTFTRMQPFARRQCFLERRDALAGELCREPGARVELFELGERESGDFAFAIGRPVERVVVDDDNAAVAAQQHVELEHVRTDLDRFFERGERVLRRSSGKAPVGDHARRSPSFMKSSIGLIMTMGSNNAVSKMCTLVSLTRGPARPRIRRVQGGSQCRA